MLEKIDATFYLDGVHSGNPRLLAKSVSIVENEILGFEELLAKLQPKNIPIIGITGPPGAGKSTLVNQIILRLLTQNKKVGVICVDPSSPFNLGALLGDRIRMTTLYNEPNVFIRSLASRGSLGGLSEKIIEVCEVFKSYPFDIIIIETVGVGQSEVEIAGIADKTGIVLVPESGDQIQNMKSGLMEIADFFIVNKADRAGADGFVQTLESILHQNEKIIPIFKTTATEGKGIQEIIDYLLSVPNSEDITLKNKLKAMKVYALIQKKRMQSMKLNDIEQLITQNPQKSIVQIAALLS